MTSMGDQASNRDFWMRGSLQDLSLLLQPLPELGEGEPLVHLLDSPGRSELIPRWRSLVQEDSDPGATIPQLGQEGGGG